MKVRDIDGIKMNIFPWKWGQLWQIPLYRNAMYLILSNGLGSVLGFAFWVVVARIYSEEEVGLTAAVIAIIPLLGMIGNLYNGIIRFLPTAKENTKKMVNASITFTLIVSILISIGFAQSIQIWAADLLFIKQDLTLFVLFVAITAASAIALLIDSIYIAKRQAELTAARNLLFNVLKLALVIVLARVSMSSGILGSWGIAIIVSVIIGLFLFLPHVQQGYMPQPCFQYQGIGEVIRYSVFNNAAVFLWTVTGRLLPMVILNILGPKSNAYFFISWTIATTLVLIPQSVSNSLLAEGSHEEKDVINQTVRSMKLVILILLPIIVILIVFGEELLSMFGAPYAAYSTQLLQVLAVSLFFSAINQVYFGTLRVQKRMKTLTGLGFITIVVTLVISLWLIPAWGILGAGVGWLLSQAIVSFWVLGKEGLGRLLLGERPENSPGDRV